VHPCTDTKLHLARLPLALHPLLAPCVRALQSEVLSEGRESLVEIFVLFLCRLPVSPLQVRLATTPEPTETTSPDLLSGHLHGADRHLLSRTFFAGSPLGSPFLLEGEELDKMVYLAT
jgi:hypothetical protein